MMVRRFAGFSAFLVFLTALLISPSLYAQDQEDSFTYVIERVEYRVTGITRQFALQNATGIMEGTRLAGKAALDAYISDKTQVLVNQRVLESSRIEVLMGQPDEIGIVKVDLIVNVEDTWNIIALPYGKFDSNTGLELTIKARDYNFLGTMQALRFDLGYEIDSEPLEKGDWAEGSLVMEIDSNTPFHLFDLDWNADFDHVLSYSSSYGTAYENKTGVSLSIPMASTKLIVGAYQGISVNEENGEEFKDEFGDRYADYWYLSNWLEAKWNIPTGLTVYGFGELDYIPSAEIRNNYRPGGEIGTEREGPVIRFAHELSFGRVDWIGNFRRGLTASIENEFAWNVFTTEWNRNVGATIAGYLPFNSHFDLSARLAGDVYFDAPNNQAGSALRGILDRSVVAEQSLFLNTDLTFSILRFMPSEWFGQNWMRVFNFEQQWTPFFDCGLVSDPENDTSFSFDDALMSGGLEIVTFPLFMRSLYIRISVGFDLIAMFGDVVIPEGEGREIFVGLGHHY